MNSSSRMGRRIFGASEMGVTSHRLRRMNFESLESRELLAGDLAATPFQVAETRGLDAHDALSLHLLTRNTFLPGVPILVRAQLQAADGTVHREVWDAAIELSTSTPGASIDAAPLQLRNGMGSALVTINGDTDLTLKAQWGELEFEKELTALSDPTIHRISGTLEGDETLLGGVVQIVDDLRVPVGHHLRIAPGTLVLVDGQADSAEGRRIIVEGSLTAAGSLDEPVTFTAVDPEQAWGEITVAGGNAEFHHTVITRAGSSPRGGHTAPGPAIRLSDDGIVSLTQSSVTDISGKIMQATSGQAAMDHTLLSRAVMGPEIQNTALDFRNSWIIHMAGEFRHDGNVDDNDGIYLHDQRAGQEIVLRGAVIAQVQDDGIDTLGADVTIHDTIVRDADDKAVSIFGGGVTIGHSLLVNAAIGVDTKGSGSQTPRTDIDRTTIANVDIGVHARDKGSPSPNVVITYNITNSIIQVLPDGDPIRTDYDPSDLHINYSATREVWDVDGSGEGNVHLDPLLADAAANDFRLSADSPAIDAGDPSAPQDPDGSRADLGVFPFSQQAVDDGDFNHDGQVDAHDVDLICAAIRGGASDDDFDLNGDQSVNSNDVNHLLDEILQTGAGDANLNGVFDSSDLVKVFQAGQYEDGIVGNSGWAEGDWNCDGEFSSSDLVAAFQRGRYVVAAR